MTKARQLEGARVVVMGLGRFGGGVGVTRWLADAGADVLLTDQASAKTLQGPLDQLFQLVGRSQIELRLGQHREADFTSADLVVVSPAVPAPWNNPHLQAARDAGARLTTEIGLLIDNLPNDRRVIGITGSAGKSTTSAMIARVLQKRLGAGRAHLGGNIGGSLLADLPTIDPQDWIVLELSSFMLHWLGDESLAATDAWSPSIAVVTNLAPNHLNWHRSMEHYVKSKAQILAHQREGDIAIFGSADARQTCDPWIAEGVKVLQVEQQPGTKRAQLAIPGAHNQHNARVAAMTAAQVLDRSDPELLISDLADFQGLPHRLELVASFSCDDADPIRCINDSKATTPEATLRAVEAVAESGAGGSVHLIAGGYDKGADLAAISDLAPQLGGLYAIGATASAIARACNADASVFASGTLKQAMRTAIDRAKPGDTILLSPGCASWDQFESFEVRGAEFARLAQEAASARMRAAKS